jgi:NADPH:quinone reductase-like Zn-dependent oxidoreductase
MSGYSPNLAALVPGIAADAVIEERKIPSPGPGEVLLRNHVIAINPIDWKRQAWGYKVTSFPVILGSGKKKFIGVGFILTAYTDIAGIVAKVGPDVTTVKPGDRVLGSGPAFSTGKNEHGAFQTYTVVRDSSVTKIPDAMSFREAATLPQGVSTAIITLFDALSLPLPKGEKYSEPTASLSPYVLLVWGGSSSIGFLTIQIARMIGLTVYAVASEAYHDKLRTIGANEVFDYRSATVVDDISAAAKRNGKTISYAFDAISVPESIAPVMKVLANGPPGTKKLAYSTTWPQDEPQVDGIFAVHPSADEISNRRVDLGIWLFKNALPGWLEDGAIKTLQYKVIEGGISGIQAAMNRLKEGVHMEKLLVEL